MVDIISSFVQVLASGFAISTLLLLIAFTYPNPNREQLRDILESSHWIFLGVVELNLLHYIFYIFEYIIPKYINATEEVVFIDRATGPYWWSYWFMASLQTIVPQVLWWKKARRSIWVGLLMIFCFYFGRIFEMFVIVISSLHRDFLPASWVIFGPGILDVIFPLGLYTILLAGVHLLRKRIGKK